MLIVTGGAGFIGSNLIQALNTAGRTDILVVDRVGPRHSNAADLRYENFMHPEQFRDSISRNALPRAIEAIFHQGASTDTTSTDRRFMIENNVDFSKAVLHFALDRAIPFVYASSASVYGASTDFRPLSANERPMNLYAESKLIFDNYTRSLIDAATSTVVGLRYFNVYGPREMHKGRMASMVYQLFRQLDESGCAQLFAGSGRFGDGEQRRDFVHVRDVVAVNLFFARSGMRRGVFNVGTGQARSFNDVAQILIARLGRGKIEYIPFPDGLRERYQDFTQADLTTLGEAGYLASFTSLETGIADSIPAWRARG